MVGFKLGAGARAAGYRVEGHDSVGSTNSEAMNAARAGAPDRLWIAALEQTSGRGRRGRPWQSRFGNLAASLYVALPATVTEPGLLGFVAGVSLARSIERLLAEAGINRDLHLKWPNDVLVDGAKLVGILLEAERLPDGRLAAVAGMGVNVMPVPAGIPYAATSLHDLGLEIGADQMFAALAESFAESFALWDYGKGSAAIMARWRLSAAGVGGQIGVALDGRNIEGRYETVDEQGRLLIALPDGGLERISAGDVYFGSAQSLRRPAE